MLHDYNYLVRYFNGDKLFWLRALEMPEYLLLCMRSAWILYVHDLYLIFVVLIVAGWIHEKKLLKTAHLVHVEEEAIDLEAQPRQKKTRRQRVEQLSSSSIQEYDHDVGEEPHVVMRYVPPNDDFQRMCTQMEGLQHAVRCLLEQQQHHHIASLPQLTHVPSTPTVQSVNLEHVPESSPTPIHIKSTPAPPPPKVEREVKPRPVVPLPSQPSQKLPAPSLPTPKAKTPPFVPTAVVPRNSPLFSVATLTSKQPPYKKGITRQTQAVQAKKAP